MKNRSVQIPLTHQLVSPTSTQTQKFLNNSNHQTNASFSNNTFSNPNNNNNNNSIGRSNSNKRHFQNSYSTRQTPIQSQNNLLNVPGSSKNINNTTIKISEQSPQKNMSQIMRHSMIVSPSRVTIQSPVRLLTPSRHIRTIQTSRAASPARIIDMNLSYEEVMDRVTDDKRQKKRQQLQQLEDQLDEDTNPQILALKRQIRQLEVEKRLSFKEGKQDSKQLLVYKSKNIILQSKVDQLTKKLELEQQEKSIAEKIFMQKIADLQLENQLLRQQQQQGNNNNIQIENQSNQSPILKNRQNKNDNSHKKSSNSNRNQNNSYIMCNDNTFDGTISNNNPYSHKGSTDYVSNSFTGQNSNNNTHNNYNNNSSSNRNNQH